MPVVAANGLRHHVRLDGREDAPVLVLANSLGTDMGMWDLIAPRLNRSFRLLRYDVRGHGASEAPLGDYRIDDLGNDLLGIADALGIERFSVFGVSLGGVLAVWAAANAPDRVEKIVVANSSAHWPDKEAWRQRIEAVRGGGMAAIVDLVMSRFFSETVRRSGAPIVDTMRSTFLATDPAGYLGCCAALRDMDLRPALADIRAPVLIVDGSLDESTPPALHSAVIAAAIPEAWQVTLETAHISVAEKPREIAEIVLAFLGGDGLPGDQAFRDGLAVRRAVLGGLHVDRSLAGMTDFNRDFQEFITRYVWGEIWTRPGLDRRTRRLLVLAVTGALGRWEEFRLHARAGLEGDVSPEDVKEVLLQTAVYAGVPAANTGFSVAREVLAETGRDQS